MRDQDHDREVAEEPRGGLKINDRRRFDSSGNERPGEKDSAAEAVKAEPVTVAKAAVSAAAPKPAPAAQHVAVNQEVDNESGDDLDDAAEAPGEESEDGISFTSFVVSLATQALMQVGAIPGPDGARMTPDKHAAKQTIDILNMITAKTKGNLSREEAGLLEEVNHRLRMAFLGRV